jgi:hypothetical protein
MKELLLKLMRKCRVPIEYRMLYIEKYYCKQKTAWET